MSYQQEIVGGYFLLARPVHVCDHIVDDPPVFLPQLRRLYDRLGMFVSLIILWQQNNFKIVDEFWRNFLAE